MGLGHYTAYVWGILPTSDIFDVIDSDEIDDLIYRLDIKSQYESKVRWLGIFIADNDGRLYREKSPDGEWQSISLTITYTAFYASDTEAYLKEVAPSQFEDAKRKWSEFAAEFERITHINLPQADLLVVHDYD
ncbi:hypothetical protein IQ243_20380 [Nostocales cyanobacterium LEGE 11386]|nr:hypothetical protein [Nostocales cyanobacterium LEGE 11386]